MKTAYIFFASLLLVACQREPANSATENATSALPTAPVIAPISSDLIRVEPASLTGCEPTVVTVRWDVQSKPKVNDVEIWVGAGSAAKLFAAGGNHGETQTGAWARPGEVFALRLAGQSEELGRTVVGGPSCP